MQNPLIPSRLAQASFSNLERLAEQHQLNLARHQPQLFAALGPDCVAVRIHTEFDSEVRKYHDDILKHAQGIELEYRNGERLDLERPEHEQFHPSQADEECRANMDAVADEAALGENHPERFNLGLPQLIAAHLASLNQDVSVLGEAGVLGEADEESLERTEQYLFWSLLTLLPSIANLPDDNSVPSWTAEYLPGTQAPQAPVCYVDLDTLSEAERKAFA